MTLTLLLDLDDTLLLNPATAFQPAYLKALAKELSQHFDPQVMIRELLAATDRMIENENPSQTLEQTFDAAFYPALNVQRSDVQSAIEHFYADVFPHLQSVTQPRPEALRLVELAQQKGYRLVVATNPLFPLTAIQQRLAWAGLPVDTTPFAAVTSYEGYHFAKPNPAYYAEILAQIGWPDDPAVMIGNDLNDDILPAARLGLCTFWLREGQPGNGQPPAQLPAGAPSFTGTFQDLLNWVAAVHPASLQQDFSSITGLLAVLKSTPAALKTMSQPLAAPAWLNRPDPREWSLTEIFCHLRDVEREVNLPRIQRVMQEENPFLPGQVTDQWAEERHYQQQDGLQALEDFMLARIEVIHMLEGLSESQWSLPARHAIFGPTTLKELVSFITTHDRSHVQQSFKILPLDSGTRTAENH